MTDKRKKAPKTPRIIDNLIPIKGYLSGHQTAGWTPGAPAMTGMGCQILADQWIPVDEEVSLSCDVYLPKPKGRYPVVLVFGAYSKELDSAGIPAGTNETGSPPIITDRGYVHVIVTRRGMGRSEGEPGVFFCDQDVDDHEKAIAWAAEQSWSDGNVVTFGTSYYGVTQVQVAVRQPPALKAFFGNELCTDYFRHIVMFGGTPAMHFTSLWLGSNFTDERTKLRMAPITRAMLSQITNSGLKPIWQRELKKHMSDMMNSFIKLTPSKASREWFVNWMLDGKTRATNCIPKGPSADLHKIDIPFVVVESLGQWNIHQFGSYELFNKASSKQKYMIMAEPEYELPVYSWQLEALAFFDYVLRGTDNGYVDQAPLRYWLDGADTYKSATDFPIPESKTTRLYLASGGDDFATHTLSATPGDGSNRWAAVPMGATVVGGFDEVANELLTYELAVNQTTELSGPVTLGLSFSCNEIDSHVVARLGRVDKDGGYHLLSLGTIRPAARKLDAARSTSCEIVLDIDTPQPLTPGVPVDLLFSLIPAPTQLQPGETLRLEIGSRTDLLKSDVAHDHPHFNMQVPPYFSRNTLHYGAGTYLELAKA